MDDGLMGDGYGGGFRDAHVHMVEHGEHLELCDLSGCVGIGGLLGLLSGEAERARGFDAGTDVRGWVRAHGFRVEGVAERRFPTMAELDGVAGDRPVVVTSFDHHACAVNGAAMRAAGIDAGTGDPAGGVIGRDARGALTGVLLESAAALVWHAEPASTAADVDRWLAAGVADLRSRGFVEAHEMKARPAMAAAVCRAMASGGLDGFGVRLHATPDVFGAVVEALDDGGLGDVDAGGVPVGLKLFVDGTVNSRTAWMLAPYAEPLETHPCGIANFTVEALAGHMRWLRDWGVSRGLMHGAEVAAHAIGDGAVRALLDAYDMVEREGGGDAGVDLRIEHAQFVAASDVGRFVRREDGSVRSRCVVASVQPCHLLPDMEAIERLLGHVSDRSFPVRDLIDSAVGAGVDPADVVVFGSDTPIVRPSVGDNVRAAVERRRVGLGAGRMIGAGQAVREDEALGLSRSRVWRGRRVRGAGGAA